MQKPTTITADSLREMLTSGVPVNIIDVRPVEERAEWFIPGSIHIDAYDKLKQNDSSALDGLLLEKSIPIVTVCTAGKTSQIAANLLQERGYKSWSLQNGMKGWSLAWNVAHKQFEGFELWQVRRTGKGCLSYVVACEKEAIIIDASLPVEVYEKIVRQYQLTAKYVVETHIHADHLSRSRDLANKLGAPLFLPVPNKVQFPFFELTEDTRFLFGKTSLSVLLSPGHTVESVSFYINNSVLFTGDTLFVSGIGRPDLKAEPDETRKRASLLFKSLQQLLSLPPNVIIFPGHTSEPIEFDGKLIYTTIEAAKKNLSWLENGENNFIDTVLKNIPPTPPNYLSIVEKNIKGELNGIDPIELEAGANRCAIS
jgi:glyoxylase-like metal-dependent hydrolase (beta-lactamase superfamily II)/rhodanese-related sulfurtransferase